MKTYNNIRLFAEKNGLVFQIFSTQEKIIKSMKRKKLADKINEN